ncbi:unnamed protein product [Allacma fusca]|uniref:Uncharacterized protein n=1 Tax=Allacma fusca TaxID=39272 RepID=A0A8J2PJQ7_9HEXA|nr:unnamed protein product [Allacma fusca]
MKEHVLTTEDTSSRKKKTLLEHYDIPIDHLDFKYITSCKDTREVERILKVLRSGEEGYFPDLEKCVAARLEELNPKSRALRVETPILRSDRLDKTELDDLRKSFLDWVDKVEEENKTDCLVSHASGDARLIFHNDFCTDVPIRTTTSEMKKAAKKESKMEEPGFTRPKNPDRIKSWEYDKWDKFDVDTELTKLEIENLQSNERHQELDVKKLKKEQELVAKYMKNIDVEEKIQQIDSNPRKQNLSSDTNEQNEIPALEDDDGNVHKPLISERTEFSMKKNSTLEIPSCSGNHSARNFIIKELQGNNKSRPSSNRGEPLGKSFIEEIPDSAEGQKSKCVGRCVEKDNINSNAKPKRRFKIQIEDLHLS